MREYFVNETIKVDGDYYQVLGRITYLNKIDGKSWDEYRLRATNHNNEERWLSVDVAYNEYSLSKNNPMASTMGYHVVDSGVAKVASVMGNVDVVVGDEVSFEEYEDRTEEKIISVEHWSDGTEYSSGYYLDPWEFGREDEVVKKSSFGGSGSSGNNLLSSIVVVLIFIIAFGSSFFQGLFSGNKKISSYLKKSSFYEYSTSITGEDKQKADVYKYKTGSSLLQNYSEAEALMSVAKNIIDGVEGNSDSIQQNDEKDDKTVAILTKKEYCIVYQGEDDEIYVQVSPRKFAYTTDKQPYRARRHTHRYYRRFYYSRGYGYDSSAFTNSHSSYSDYSDGSIDYNSGNDLNSYSNSVRQSSVASRSSDGGGLSSGK